MYFKQKTRHILTILIAIAFMASAFAIANAKTTVVTHKITVTQSPGGTITPKGTGTPAQVSVKDGKDSIFTITPAKGYSVASIVTDEGDVTSSATKTNKGYTYKFPKVTGDHTITATFEKGKFTLTVTVSGDSGSTGSVSADTGSLTCSNNVCTGTYESGTTVTLTETPGFNSNLKNWTGCKAKAQTCVVIINKDTNVTLKFKKAKSAGIKGQFTGNVQKGPFINGTSVTIYELDSTLNPTGKTFVAQTDNLGAFDLPDVRLASQYAELKADGYYFNEVSGSTSTSQITLYALVDLSDKSTININVLTHLERDRVKTLIANGYSFADAKKQAQKEILAIFEITKDSVAASETMDLSKDGEDNGILLAISAILQSNRTEGEMSELLANMITDLEEDGTLETSANGSALINGAKYINTATIKTNLTDRYKTLGTTVTIPDITSMVTNFVTNTKFLLTELITYPDSGTYGPNVLSKNLTNYQMTSPPHPEFGADSMSAIVPKGHSLKVRLSGEYTNGAVSWLIGSIVESTGWQWGSYEPSTYSNTFTSTQSGTLDQKLWLQGGKVTVEVYEDGAASPTWSKTITAQ